MKPSQSKSDVQATKTLLSAQAFKALYQHNHLVVYRYIFGLHGGPGQDVEDLSAETFERAWKARRRFRGDSDDALKWLLRIARNLVYDRHRHQARRGQVEDIDKHIILAPHANPEEQIAKREQVHTLWQSLSRLSQDRREILVLRYLLGWQVKEIAAYLKMKENTVSVHIRRSLDQLRRDWSQKEDRHDS
jgi:RNA polymerase sigma-70 factor (ECF subfamily)